MNPSKRENELVQTSTAVEKFEEDIDSKFRKACDDGSIRNLKIIEMREFLNKKDMPSGGVKNFLISMV